MTPFAPTQSLLDVIGPTGAHALRRDARRRQYRRREIIFRQGDLGDTVHFVERGHVTVQGEGMLDEPVTLAVLGPGDYFGDLAVLSPDSRRSATIQALDSVVTYEITGTDFIALRDGDSGVRRAMSESLAGTCRRLVERLLDARHQDARGRLLRQLGRLHDLFDGPIPFTQQDLAHYIGVTRVTVNQLLAGLAADGLVEVRRGWLVVLDPVGLEAVSPA